MNREVMAAYGAEDEDFYLEHIRRTKHDQRAYHFHDTYEIYYLISGRMNCFIKDSSYEVKAGDLVLIDKNTIHETSYPGSSEHERIVVTFRDRFLFPNRDGEHARLAELMLRPFRHSNIVLNLNEQESSFVESIFYKIERESREAEAGFELYIKHLLAELLIFCTRWQEISTAPPPWSPANTLHHKISQIVKHINAEYDKPLSLSVLANEFQVSPHHLSRSFKQVTGYTVMEYIKMTRIKEAQRLLLHTDLKVVDICLQTGFNCLAYFQRVFKKMTQMTPVQYRKQGSGSADAHDYNGDSVIIFASIADSKYSVYSGGVCPVHLRRA
jgi:AraC-like DNA-binding protein